MNVLELTKKAKNGVATTQDILKNPFDFVSDTFITFIVKALIPVPVAQELIIYLKGPILALCCGTILFFIILLFLVISAFILPLSTTLLFANAIQKILP